MGGCTHGTGPLRRAGAAVGSAGGAGCTSGSGSSDTSAPPDLGSRCFPGSTQIQNSVEICLYVIMKCDII